MQNRKGKEFVLVKINELPDTYWDKAFKQFVEIK